MSEPTNGDGKRIAEIAIASREVKLGCQKNCN
jgi:hypothetical protein